MFHPRSFKHMGDEALRAAEEMLSIIDMAGAFPNDATLVLNSLIPKPAGGQAAHWVLLVPLPHVGSHAQGHHARLAF